MAKAIKKKSTKKREKRVINIDTDMTFDEFLKVAANTPKKKKK